MPSRMFGGELRMFSACVAGTLTMHANRPRFSSNFACRMQTGSRTSGTQLTSPHLLEVLA